MAEPPPVLTLLVEKGPRKGQCLQHRAGAVLRVGRVIKGNNLAVGDAGASQRHLDIAFLPPPASRWAATDLGSSNGTLLNGAPLVPTIPAPLSDGDRIKIGESSVLAISIAADAGPEPVATRRSTRQAAAAVAEEEEENKAPAVRRGRRKAPAAADPPEAVKVEAEVAPRRGGRRKAPAATDPPEADKGEAEVAPRRGGRKKAPAVDPLEEENKEAAAPVTRRGGRKKAVERHEADSEEEEVLAGGPSKAPVTDALPPQRQTTRSTRATARRAEAVGTGQGKGEDEQTRGGRGRVTRQNARKARKAEGPDSAALLAPRGQTQTAEEGRADTHSADKDEEVKESGREEGNTIDHESRESIMPESKSDGVGEAEEDGKRELSGCRGEEGGSKNVSNCPGGCNLENMTLREWFVQMEKYILAKNHEAAEKAIAEVEEKHKLFTEYIKTLK